MPSAVNHPDKGMVYADGKTSEEWNWTAVKVTPIPEADRERYPIPGKPGEYYENKMDTSTSKQFIERDFIEALDYIGVFENSEQ